MGISTGSGLRRWFQTPGFSGWWFADTIAEGKRHWINALSFLGKWSQLIDLKKAIEGLIQCIFILPICKSSLCLDISLYWYFDALIIFQQSFFLNKTQLLWITVWWWTSMVMGKKRASSVVNEKNSISIFQNIIIIVNNSLFSPKDARSFCRMTFKIFDFTSAVMKQH